MKETGKDILGPLQDQLEETRAKCSEAIKEKQDLEDNVFNLRREIYKLTLLEGHLVKMIEIIKEK